MGLAQPQASYTIEEYLAFERTAEERHEFLDGEIYAMAGEGDDHGDISVNICGELHAQLKGKDCRARLKIPKFAAALSLACAMRQRVCIPTPMS